MLSHIEFKKNLQQLVRYLSEGRLIRTIHFDNLLYYPKNAFHRYCYPRYFKNIYKKKLYNLLQDKTFKKEIFQRVNYYCKIKGNFSLQKEQKNINQDPFIIFKSNSKDILSIDCQSVYTFDLWHYMSFFNPKLMSQLLPSDVIINPEEYAITKSRPISENERSVLFKLNKVRHFKQYAINDKKKFSEKTNKLVWRGEMNQNVWGFRRYERIKFLEKYYGHEMMDVAQATKPNKKYYGKWLSREDQFNFKYILSIEGNDVATNLKWIFGSNSLCFMTKPKYESWFMEGILKPGVHYVQIKDDYSDIIEKMEYYNSNPKEAEDIIYNANQHHKIFLSKKSEDIIQLLILEKYYHYSGQIKSKFVNYFE